MTELPFVRPEHHEMARGLEAEVQKISAEAGILFVGVSAAPTRQGDPPSLSVVAGCSRDVEEEAVRHLLLVRLPLELPDDASLDVTVFRGVAVRP